MTLQETIWDSKWHYRQQNAKKTNTLLQWSQKSRLQINESLKTENRYKIPINHVSSYNGMQPEEQIEPRRTKDSTNYSWRMDNNKRNNNITIRTGVTNASVPEVNPM